jgi:hypothetical protein
MKLIKTFTLPICSYTIEQYRKGYEMKFGTKISDDELISEIYQENIFDWWFSLVSDFKKSWSVFMSFEETGKFRTYLRDYFKDNYKVDVHVLGSTGDIRDNNYEIKLFIK